MRFKTLDEAEEFYQIDYFEGQETYNFDPIRSTPVKDQSGADVPVSSCLSPVFQQSLSEVKGQEMATGDLIRVMTDGYLKMTNRQRLQFLSFLFSMYLCYDVGIDGNFVPSDFIQLAGNSFKQLQAAGVKNTVYFLVRTVGALRSDGSDPRMPLDRMPFGLIHHNLEFFSNDNCTNLHPVDHYAEWQTTMFAHFGHKWDKLFRGPMWSYDGETSDEDDMSSIGDAATPEIQEAEVPVASKDLLSQAATPILQEAEVHVASEDLLTQAASPEVQETEVHMHRSVATEDLLTQAVNITDGLSEMMTAVEEIEPSTEEIVAHQEFSSLWSGLSASDQMDLQQASVLPQQIEELHNVRPSKRRRHGKAQDPMKVYPINKHDSSVQMWIIAKGRKIFGCHHYFLTE